MENKDISKTAQANLAQAYMYLYKKLVSTYQSNGDSVGQSQFNAICAMRAILSAYDTHSKKTAVKFLSKLYNTHRGVVAKKTMISPNKDDVIIPVPQKCGFGVALAISKLEEAIFLTYAPSLPTLYQLPSISAPIVVKDEKPKRNFYTWVRSTANPADIQKLQHDTRYFGQLYNRYVTRQKHK